MSALEGTIDVKGTEKISVIDSAEEKVKIDFDNHDDIDDDRPEKDKKKKKRKSKDRDREKKHRDGSKERKRNHRSDADDDEELANVEKIPKKISVEEPIDDVGSREGRKDKERDKEKEKEREKLSDSKRRDRDDDDRSRGEDDRRLGRDKRRSSRDRDDSRDRREKRRRDDSRDRRSRRSPTPPRRRYRSPSYDRGRDRDRRRDRSPDRRRRSRTRSPDRDRDRDTDRGRERDVDRVRERDGDRSKDRDKDRSPDRKKASTSQPSSSYADDSNQPKPLTLKDVISLYPGISLAEAAQKLNAHNTALAMGTALPIVPPQAGSIGGASGANAFGGLAAAPGVATATAAATAALSALAGAPPAIMGLSSLVGEGGAATKPQRELYVGNIPPGTTVPQLAEFINAVMKQLGLTISPMGSVVTAWVSADGHYAFVEFRTIEETQSAMQYLNGLQVGAHSLKVGRPKGYTGGSTSAVAVPMGAVPASAGLGPTFPSNNPLLASAGLSGLTLGGSLVGPLAGMAGMTGSSLGGFGLGIGGASLASPTSNVIMVTNLPLGIDEEQVRELVATFGEVSAFNLIKTSGTSQSAVLQYKDVSVTDDAILGLNKLEIANFRLAVQRVPAESASILLQPIAPLNASAQPSTAPSQANNNLTTSNLIDSDPLSTLPPTRILRLSNMATDEDLSDNELYEDLRLDIEEECSKYGNIESIQIPRAAQYGGDPAMATAVGQIFIYFSTAEGADKCRKAVAGRIFNGKTVLACFYPEELYLKKICVVPADYFSSKAQVAAQAKAADPDAYFNDPEMD